MSIYMERAMIEEKGITLIELLVVISIIGIIVIALGFSYRGWQAGYRVESAIKQIYSDMMEARMLAMSRNVVYFADFPAGAPQIYRIFQDTNSSLTPEIGAGDNILAPFPKPVEYVLTREWANPAAAVSFQIRGTIQAPDNFGDTICIDDVANPNLAGIARDYDCIIIGQTRINMGRLTVPAGACNAANCLAR